MIADLSALSNRALTPLTTELETYSSEGRRRTVRGEVPNSAGNLTRHLAGDLGQFVIDGLGSISSGRDCPAQIRRRDVPRAEVLARPQRTLKAVQDTLVTLADSRLDDVDPGRLPGFLVHLYRRLTG